MFTHSLIGLPAISHLLVSDDGAGITQSISHAIAHL
jgi:hypothetical protein